MQYYSHVCRPKHFTGKITSSSLEIWGSSLPQTLVGSQFILQMWKCSIDGKVINNLVCRRFEQSEQQSGQPLRWICWSNFLFVHPACDIKFADNHVELEVAVFKIKSMMQRNSKHKVLSVRVLIKSKLSPLTACIPPNAGKLI